jgi:hypothetical protein
MSYEKLQQFADQLKSISRDIGFKVSARGWCYILENQGTITKDQFNLVNNWINEAVVKGLLPVDFVAEDSSRQFSGVEFPDGNIKDYLKDSIRSVNSVSNWYTPDWWDGEQYYIQVVVEKIDLKTLFQPIAKQYHIPIANARGWSSILQRAEFARRFKDAEERGLKCVLLYCGDHDPDGLRISETMRKNLQDLQNVQWADGETGYDPTNLVIHRFGLNYDFITKNHLSWIDNLTTGSGKDLASPSHRNHSLPYVQDYLARYGARKCEANALVIAPQAGRQLFEDTIKMYVGDALQRFNQKRTQVKQQFTQLFQAIGWDDLLQRVDDIL